MNHPCGWVSCSDGSNHDARSNKTKEGKPRGEGANAHAYLIPGETQNGHNLQGKSRGGKEHAQLVAPFEELNREHGEAETAGLDDAGIAFRHGTFADVVVMVVLAVRGVYRVCAVGIELEGVALGRKLQGMRLSLFWETHDQACLLV